jgi:hypothetical protein
LVTSTTTVGIAVIGALGAWYLHTRKHPNWQRNRDARFYITLGYPFTGVAVFFLANTVGHTDLNWLIGMAWALVATLLFVCGFQALHDPLQAGYDAPSGEAMDPPSTPSISRPDVDA